MFSSLVQSDSACGRTFVEKKGSELADTVSWKLF
jgi:hypothetical protein